MAFGRKQGGQPSLLYQFRGVIAKKGLDRPVDRQDRPTDVPRSRHPLPYPASPDIRRSRLPFARNWAQPPARCRHRYSGTGGSAKASRRRTLTSAAGPASSKGTSCRCASKSSCSPPRATSLTPSRTDRHKRLRTIGEQGGHTPRPRIAGDHHSRADRARSG